MKKYRLAITLIVVIVSVSVITALAQINLNSNPKSNSGQPQTYEIPIPTSPSITIYVPDNYSTIQTAVNSAPSDAVIFVREGDYNSSVTVNKAVWLIGENGQARIDAHSLGPDLIIWHSDVNVTGFTLTNTPTPATGSWIEHMQGIGLPVQLPAIQVKYSQNCNIYQNNITNSSNAVSIENSNEISVFDNEINGNGIRITASTNNTIVENNLVGGGTGIVLDASSGNILVNNTIRDTATGIAIRYSSGNTLRSNTLTHNYYSFSVSTNNLAEYDNDVDASNTIEGKPIYYWIGRENTAVPSDGACVILVNCTGMTVQDSTLSLGAGVLLANTNSSLVQNVTLATQDPALLAKYATPGNPLDIRLYNSYNNQVRSSCATVWLNSSDSNIITQNTGVIRLTYSNYNQIVGNNIRRVAFPGMDWTGINLKYSAFNLIKENNITDNSAGVWLCDGTKNNMVENNMISDNSQGGVIVSVWPESTGPLPELNLIFNNTITANGNEGIQDAANGTQIIGNKLVANQGSGLEMGGDVNCRVSGNVIEGFYFGYYKRNVVNCTIEANNITVNSKEYLYGVKFQSATPGTFYHNNFFVPIDFSYSQNATMVWENGREGNWWYNYTGADANGDGIGDTPYQIGPNNVDPFPLMKPYDINFIAFS
jgi:parallel beta-helix repeat protein